MADKLFEIENGILYAFAGGEEAIIPEGVAEIAQYCFAGHTELRRVVLPESVRVIGQQAFRSCLSLESINLPEGIERIERFTFCECGALTKIVIPESVREICGSAFRGCDMLCELTLPEKMERIAESAFSDCASIKSVIIPKGIEVIKKRAFSDCRDMTELVIPEGVRELDDNAFEYCSSLKSVVLPESLERIGRHTFSGCSSLESVYVPESVSFIGSGAFYKTPITERRDNEFVTLGGGVLTSCLAPGKDVTVPNDVRIIGENAFSQLFEMKSVTIPEGVIQICDLAFEGCISLERAELPSTLEHIGSRAFVDCQALESIDLPEGLRSIGTDAFYGTAKLLQDHSPVVIYNNKYLYRCSIDARTYEVPEGITLIADGAFSGASGIEELILPKGLKYIGKGACKWLSSLKSVRIPESVSFVGDEAFFSSGSAHITLSTAGKEIGQAAFPHEARVTFLVNGREFTVTLEDDSGGDSQLLRFTAEPTDEHFAQLEYKEYKIPAAVCLSGELSSCRRYLEDNIEKALCFAVKTGDDTLLEAIVALDIAGGAELDAAIDYAITLGRIEQQVMLMREKNKLLGTENVDSIMTDRFDI